MITPQNLNQLSTESLVKKLEQWQTVELPFFEKRISEGGNTDNATTSKDWFVKLINAAETELKSRAILVESV